MKTRFGFLVLGTASLAGCVSPSTDRGVPPSVVQPPAPTYAVQGLESVMGRSARTLVGLLGQPGLDVREGPARKLQVLGPACVLDAYLYPPRGGGEAVVSHVDARLPDGRDMDRASCVAALTAQQRER